MYSIYKLVDPRSNELMYIGITKSDIHYRLATHIHEAFLGKRKFVDKQKWIKELITNGLLPKVELIEATENIKREKHYIQILKPKLNIVFNNSEQLSRAISIRKSKPVYQYDLNGEFLREWSSATEAANYYNVSNENICSCTLFKGRRQVAGYMWRATKEEKINPYRKDIFMKEVHMYDKEGNYIKSFPSARAVSTHTYKQVSKCCTGRVKVSKGVRFSFEKKSKI